MDKSNIMYKDRMGNYHKKPENITSENRKSAYGIFIENNTVLVVKPTWAKLWEFPDGGTEKNERLIEALKREFLEETGYKILDLNENPVQKIKTKFYADDIDMYFNSELFFFKVTKVGIQNKLLINKTEIKDIRLIQISELNEKNMKDIHFNILKK